eukprot:5185324-Prymnesium_polylepis.1
MPTSYRGARCRSKSSATTDLPQPEAPTIKMLRWGLIDSGSNFSSLKRVITLLHGMRKLCLIPGCSPSAPTR